MLGNIFPPYHSLQELNLDWILTKVKNILRFVPDDGAVGQILRRTAHGAEWSDEQAAGVSSVNGQTGDVVLSIPDSTSDLVNDSGFVDAAGAAAAAPVQSVNGQTGAVSLSIPDSTSDLVNDSGFVDAAGAAAAAPVQSVNGQTGAVVISGTNIQVKQCTASVTLSANAKTYHAFDATDLVSAGATITGFALLTAPNTDWVISSPRYFPNDNQIRVYMNNTYNGTITGNIILNVSYYV